MDFPRCEEHGGPKLYACWVDESHNQILRELSRFAHRRTYEMRIFNMLKFRAILASPLKWLSTLNSWRLRRRRA